MAIVRVARGVLESEQDFAVAIDQQAGSVPLVQQTARGKQRDIGFIG